VLTELASDPYEIAEWSEYAGQVPALNDIAARLGVLGKTYVENLDSRRWTPLDDALELAGYIVQAQKHAAVDDGAAKPEQRAAKTKLVKREELVAEIRRLLDADSTLAGQDPPRIRDEIERPDLPMVLLRRRYKELAEAAGQSAIERTAARIVRDLGAWAEAPDLVSPLADLNARLDDRRAALNRFITQTAPFQREIFPDAMNSGRADEMNSVRRRLHETIRKRLQSAMADAGRPDESNLLFYEPGLCRLADMFFMHRVFKEIEAVRVQAEAASSGADDADLGRLTRALSLWPMRAGTTFALAQRMGRATLPEFPDA
jgi:hypothetical protein